MMRGASPSIQNMPGPDDPMPGLIVVLGSEPLLVIEAADSVRERAREQGFTERHNFVMDVRSDWQQIALAAGTGSLFGDKQLIEVTVPSGKPGKTGGQAIIALTQQYGLAPATDAAIVFRLPALDRQTRDTAWCKALLDRALVLQCPAISRDQLPEWIRTRLAQQQQSTDTDVLTWMADHVEGNLLAAHQEILKLGLLYPAGHLDAQQVQSAVMNVARYDVMALRDAIFDADAPRALRVLEGLKSEGEALPLVLWAVSDELRTMLRILQASERGQSLSSLMRANRIFGAREIKFKRLLSRINSVQVIRAIRHAHEIDRIIKGIDVSGRMNDAWQEISRLTLHLAMARTR